MELAPQPSLRDKVAHFELMKKLTEESDDSDDGHGTAAQQRRHREDCMRFFSAAVASPPDSTASADDRRRHHHHHRPAAPPRDDDAKTTTVTVTPIIKATQPHLMRGRVRDTPAERPDETVIPDTRRVSKTTTTTTTTTTMLRRSLRTPLSVASALPQALDPSRGSAATTTMEDSPSLGARHKAKKRKQRSESLAVRPEGEQIFKGLRFYYVPDDDVAPVRRLRIGKAREFGASWTREAEGATHVIVDKGIPYADVEKMIGQGGGEGEGEGEGTGTRVVVNEEYPIDCIRFRSLLDHRQKKYAVPGQTRDKDPSEREGRLGQYGVESRGQTDAVGDFSRLTVKPPQQQQQHRRTTSKSGHILDLGTPSARHESSCAEDGGSDGKANETVTPSAEAQAMTGPDVGSSPSDREDAVGRKRSKEQQRGSDELSRYITMMQEFKGLPLDNDDDDDDDDDDGDGDEPHPAAAGYETGRPSDDDEEARSGPDDLEQPISKRIKSHHHDTRTRKKTAHVEEQFACHQAGAQNADANNPNARTIEVLQGMADYYDRINDHWRSTGYRKAISTLKRHGVKITSEQQAVQLPHIGQRIAQKIEEIATTNELRRLKYAEEQHADEPARRALQLFLRIHGVGTAQAQRWLSMGYRTLDDLRTRAKLSPGQRIGVDHFDDLNSRIPRHEVEALGAYVCRAAARVDPSLEVIIGGSYRRGAPTSGDIDFVLTKPDTTSTEQLRPSFTRLLDVLTAEGFLTARLAQHRPSGSSRGSKFHGCCVLPSPSATDGASDKTSEQQQRRPPLWRRIDFLLVPESERGAALIYFTGNDIFNRSMRLLARRKGMCLNQRGLFRRTGGGVAGELVEGRCERRIFEVLGVQWREAWERWC
ncbi:hypothetical protein E4U43_000247 [Claviceps pusilla]|uniref:DNA polymerase lambda n=1 Tax=Claviceps pusilla TaxID=123648 RepID=A0A9P7NC87_9HYPO|nr:hypothetical protein E4U43_000247 [Claviceps pusilla]